MNKFNVRVYGICIDDHQRLLVTDELIHGHEVTKLPGGGLEFGEGSIDCIKREFLEETGQAVEVLNHFYTTDFFQVSAFNKNSQVISIYYRVKLLEAPGFRIQKKRFEFESRDKDTQVFRLIALSDLKPDDFTFPIDQHVAKMLIAEIKKAS